MGWASISYNVEEWQRVGILALVLILLEMSQGFFHYKEVTFSKEKLLLNHCLAFLQIDLMPCVIGDSWILTPAVHIVYYNGSCYLWYMKKMCPHIDRKLGEEEVSPDNCGYSSLMFS